MKYPPEPARTTNCSFFVLLTVSDICAILPVVSFTPVHLVKNRKKRKKKKEKRKKKKGKRKKREKQYQQCFYVYSNHLSNRQK
jgi:hypothetical protein